MTARQFAEAMGVEYRTVVRWLSEGIVPDAELKEVMPGVKWWEIKETALQMDRPKAGRRKASKKAAK